MGVLDIVLLAILAILLVGVLFLILIVAAIPGVSAKKRHSPWEFPPRQKPATFSHPQNMPTRTLHEIVALSPVGPHHANLL
jgi:hypothetical protein